MECIRVYVLLTLAGVMRDFGFGFGDVTCLEVVCSFETCVSKRV